MIPPFPRDSPHVYEMATDSAPDCAGRFDETTEAFLCRLRTMSGSCACTRSAVSAISVLRR
jgi:hypothetical protein